MKSRNFRAFTFVELLITLSILSLLAVIGYTAVGNKQENTLNTKITSEVETLKNALLLAKQENSVLPLPDGNNNFYTIDTSYVHDYQNSDTYGVHGFITQNTLAKKYIDVIPVDPRTNSYYAYGKTKGSEMYEIASVIFENQDAKSRVIGDYTALEGPFNLIREYNGPYFVADNSTQNFAYNPYEKVLSAQVGENSGDISINGNLLSTEEIQNITLVTGDNILVPQNSHATLYFSDGTTSILGDTSQETQLILQNLEFPSDTNLITKIQLVLQSGMIWNKAASLDEESQFEIYTIDSTAAVRGTIFGVQKNISNSKILVSEGKVAVYKNYENSLEILLEKLKNNETITQKPVTGNNITFNQQTLESQIIVENNQSTKGVEINSNTQGEVSNNINALENISEESKKDIFENRVKFSDDTTFEINEFTMNSNRILEKFVLKINKNIWNSTDSIIFNDQNNSKLIELKTQDIQNSQILGENNVFYIDVTNNLYHVLSHDTDITGSQQNSGNQSPTPDTSSITTPAEISQLHIYLSQTRHEVEYTSKVISIPVFSDTYISQEVPEDEAPLLVRENPILPPLDEESESEDESECSNPFGLNNEYCWEKTAGINLQNDFELKYFAPYDVAGDINMYKQDSSYTSLGNGSILSNSLELPNYCNDGSNKYTSFCVQEDGNKGIFIDNTDNDDYIKYYGLDLDNDFIIEMNVYWTQSDNKHYLIHSGNKFKLYIDGNKLYLNNGTGSYSDNELILSNNTLNNIQIKNSSNNTYLKVGTNDWIEFVQAKPEDYIYIGALRNGSKFYGQINSVIDYIKIYDK